MAIYVGRGLDPALAHQVAEQLMAHDALGAHARDELGITETLSARPLQAALASAWLRGGRRPAAPGHRPRPEARLLPSSLARPWPASRSWGSGARGRGAGDGGCPARHLLGGAGHGAHRRRRGALRHRGVSAGHEGAPLRPRTRHAPAGFQERLAPGVQGHIPVLRFFRNVCEHERRPCLPCALAGRRGQLSSIDTSLRQACACRSMSPVRQESRWRLKP